MRRDVIHAARSRDSQHRIAIRHKLAVLTLAPLITLTVVVTLKSVNLQHETDQVKRESSLATATDGPSGLLGRLQDERTWTAVELIGQDGLVAVPVEGYDETRSATDAALAGFEQQLTTFDADTQAAFAPAMEALQELDGLRQRIDAFDAPRTIDNAAFGEEMFADYSEMIDPLLDAVGDVARQVGHPELRQGAQLVSVASNQVEVVGNLARNTITFSLLSEGGVDTPEEITGLSDSLEEFKENARTIESNQTGLYRDTTDMELLHVFTVELAANVGQAIHTGGVDLERLLAIVNVPTEQNYIGYRQRVSEILRANAADVEGEAANRQRLYLAVLAVAVAAAVIAALGVSRSITRPLRALTGQTADMANRHLPHAVLEVLETPVGDDVVVPEVAPIRVRTTDEIAELADAVNTVQDSALELAVGQAVLRRNVADSLVNLGRRNQNLLTRQIDLITNLEREADPDTLANLFQLDHLATRMRRNAESLLVLAEIDPPRSTGAPVRVADVIRAALGEVEDFRRVTVQAEPTTLVLGSAAADLAHLCAELLENALMFSSPDQYVEVHGQRHQHGYTIAIVDHGVGLTPEDLDQANRRLGGTESFTVAPSKYLGHYVVGNLAQRHDIAVRLQGAVGRGVTASVDIPTTLLPPDSANPPAWAGQATH
jgi:signal transduction histidine kinase